MFYHAEAPFSSPLRSPQVSIIPALECQVWRRFQISCLIISDTSCHDSRDLWDECLTSALKRSERSLHIGSMLINCDAVPSPEAPAIFFHQPLERWFSKRSLPGDAPINIAGPVRCSSESINYARLFPRCDFFAFLDSCHAGWVILTVTSAFRRERNETRNSKIAKCSRFSSFQLSM